MVVRMVTRVDLTLKTFTVFELNDGRLRVWTFEIYFVWGVMKYQKETQVPDQRMSVGETRECSNKKWWGSSPPS